MRFQYADMMMAPGSLQWWALYTRHQHEKQIADALTAKGFDVFLPLYESVRRWKDRRKVLSLPLFPGYVFVRGVRDRRLAIISTPGVHMVLSRGDVEAVIPEEEVEAIRRTIDSKFAIEPHPYLNCGDRVRIKRGALEGLEGILVRKKNLLRLVLSIEMLAQSVCVELDGTEVEPARIRPPQIDWTAPRKNALVERFAQAAAPTTWRTSVDRESGTVTIR
ncbi:MAG TPA: UpxY family transcription antiterminator [Terracidiphilus sp.]